jgi:hypothetical protein
MGVSDRFNDESKKSSRKPERRQAGQNGPSQDAMPGTGQEQEGTRARGQRSRNDEQSSSGARGEGKQRSSSGQSGMRNEGQRSSGMGEDQRKRSAGMSEDERKRSGAKHDDIEDTMEQHDMKDRFDH